ncbi:ER-golgi trafficking TRAPP I complex 85 kDa subunit-domain-containing protein, partial [Rhodotorula diobovata]
MWDEPGVALVFPTSSLFSLSSRGTTGSLSSRSMADLVAQALCPVVHCFATQDVVTALERNHLGSLSHLLSPFVALDNVQLRLPSTLHQRTAPRFHLHLVDRTLTPSSSPSPSPSPSSITHRDELFVDHLGHLVAHHALVSDSDLNHPPPYSLVRDAVLSRRDDPVLVPFESFSHPLAALVALSTSHPDPLNALAHLWDLVSPANLYSTDPHSARDFASPDILRFVVLVHDQGAGGGPAAWADAQRLHDTVQKTYGVHSALLPLFSAAPNAVDRLPRAEEAPALWAHLDDARERPESYAEGEEQAGEVRVVGLGFDADADADADDSGPAAVPSAPSTSTRPTFPPQRGLELSPSDLTSLRTFAREFVLQSLVPFLERRGVLLHEQWQASRRGIGG